MVLFIGQLTSLLIVPLYIAPPSGLLAYLLWGHAIFSCRRKCCNHISGVNQSIFYHPLTSSQDYYGRNWGPVRFVFVWNLGFVFTNLYEPAYAYMYLSELYRLRRSLKILYHHPVVSSAWDRNGWKVSWRRFVVHRAQCQKNYEYKQTYRLVEICETGKAAASLYREECWERSASSSSAEVY